MGYKDYTKFSNSQEHTEEIQNGFTKTEDDVVEEVLEQSIIEEVSDQPVMIEPVAPKIGFVIDCAKLNVRSEPYIDSDIVCVIPGSTEVEVDEENSTDDFYKICTYSGVEGFCMKKFIQLKG